MGCGVNKPVHITIPSKRQKLGNLSSNITGDCHMPLDNAGNILAQARKITLSTNVQTFREAIGAFDLNDYYRFNTSKSRTFDLNLDGLIVNADVQLLNKAGQVIASSANDFTSPESIRKTLPPGTYYIRVFSEDALDQSMYNLRVSGATDPGGTRSQASSLTLTSTPLTIRDRIEPGVGDSSDYYRFNVTKPTILDGDKLITGGFNAAILNNQGTVINPTIFSLAPSTEISYYALNPGTYYVGVSANTVGNYDLTLDTRPAPGSSRATAPTVRSNFNAIELTGEDGQNFYRFTLPQTSTFFLSDSESSRVPPTETEVLNSSGQVINPIHQNSFSESIVSSDEKIYQLSAGTYYVRAFSPTGENVPHILSFSAVAEAGGSRSSARSIDPTNISIQEAINRFKDPNDYYRFTVAQASQFDLSIYSSTEENIYPPGNVSLQLLDSAGAVIATTGSRNSATGTISRLLNAGTYYVRVFLGGGDSSSYDLNISAVPDERNTDVGGTLKTARTIKGVRNIADPLGGRLYQGSIDNLDNDDGNDFYKFTLPSDSNLGAELYTSGNLGIQLYDKNGTKIASSNPETRTPFLTTLLAGGTYYLRVFANTADVETDYALQLFTI
jgi:hypothetical protein